RPGVDRPEPQRRRQGRKGLPRPVGSGGVRLRGFSPQPLPHVPLGLLPPHHRQLRLHAAALLRGEPRGIRDSGRTRAVFTLRRRGPNAGAADLDKSLGDADHHGSRLQAFGAVYREGRGIRSRRLGRRTCKLSGGPLFGSVIGGFVQVLRFGRQLGAVCPRRLERTPHGNRQVHAALPALQRCRSALARLRETRPDWGSEGGAGERHQPGQPVSEAIPGFEAPKALAPRDAAVAVVIRNPAPELEVLWAHREGRLKFGGGFYAFPGGGSESEDQRVPVLGASGLDATLRVTAARELFEETGILLADGASSIPQKTRAEMRRAPGGGGAKFGHRLPEHGRRASEA